MKTYTFKPEFEEKLKRLKIKTRFIKNIKTLNESKYLVMRESLNNNSFDWHALISEAFTWNGSPEGHRFWSNIANHD